jgi:hypothetical protein
VANRPRILHAQLCGALQITATNREPCQSIQKAPNPRPRNFLNREIREIRENSRPFPPKKMGVRVFRVFRGSLFFRLFRNVPVFFYWPIWLFSVRIAPFP